MKKPSKKKPPKTRFDEIDKSKHLGDYLKDAYLPKGQGQCALLLLHLLYEQGARRRWMEDALGVLDASEKKICAKIKEFMDDDATKDTLNHILLIMKETKGD